MNGEWFQEAKLTPEDIASEYQFGRSVSISGDKAVVASFGAERTDAAYVYTRDSNGVWQQETKLIPSNVSTDNFFNNSSVCISGDRILLVASINNGESGNLSSAFIYIRDENGLWSEESKLPKSDGYAHTVGLDGDKALVASKFGGMVNFFTSDTSPIQLDIQALITSPPCSGSENGSIQIDATGGKTPYRYELLDENLNVIITAQENNIFENLGQGTYIVKVIDDTTQEIFTNALAIIEPEILQATPIINNVACHGSNDGSVEIVVNGGSTPYQYSINGGGSTSNNEFTNLSPATYTFEVIDANGCQITTDVTIDQPEILGMDKYKTDTSCRGLNDGSITINGSGGVTPYEFSLDGANFETVNSFVDLSPATYDVYIKDARGCTQTTQVVVSEPNGSDFDNDGLGDSCDYDIDGDGIANENDKCSQTSLGSLVDSDGCVFFSLPADNFTVQATGATCPNTTNGSINISAILPFDYTAILTGNTFIESKQFDKSLSFENLGAGIYDVCVTIDEHSDFEECFSVEITEPEALSVSSRTDSSGKSLVLNLSGGINYNVNLNDTIYYIDENEIILPLSEIENSLTVTTDRECQGIYRETILVAFGLSLYPNPVERGDVTLRIEDNSINDVQLFLYTSSGRQIFQKTAKVENGTVMIKMNGLSSGMYSLKLETPKEIYTRKIIKI